MESTHPLPHDSARRAETWFRLLLMTIIVGLLLFFNRQPLLQLLNAAAPDRKLDQERPVDSRGPLIPEEAANIRVFEEASPSVVWVNTLANVRILRGFVLEEQQIREGTGSGFVWDQEGHIVTNFHVVKSVYQQKTQCEVTLRDGSKFPAQLVGVAIDKDLAVLKLKAPTNKLAGLRPIKVGQSADLKIGQNVYAIGNPFGLDYTMTRGIVSALGRHIVALSDRQIDNVIQTDAAINPGNSGGPLLDSAARLIGINTMIRAGGEGIGFAIPVDTITTVVPRVIRTGGYMLGIGVEVLAAQQVGIVGFDRGLIIRRVLNNSSAQRGGLRNPRELDDGDVEVDILLAVDDVSVNSQDELAREFDKHQPGDRVRLKVQRGRKLLDLTVTLEVIESLRNRRS